MSKDWKKELEEYIARATKRQHISDNLIIAMADPAHKAKLSAAHKGRSQSAEHKEKVAAAKAGVPRTEKAKASIAAARTGIPRSKETKAKLSAANKGIPLSEDRKAKVSASLKSIPKLTCPHCDLEGGAGAMKRHHFDNCKLK